MTNDIAVHTTSGPEAYELSRAILIYSSRSKHYASVHHIERGPGGARIGAGEPATVEACAEFVNGLADKAKFTGFVEPRMVYIGPRTVVWWRAPLPARVWFDTTEAEAGDQKKATIGKRSAITPQPGLVFALSNGKWFVAAFKGANRPTSSTRLYVAPYFNVWKGGHICEGNVSRPEKVTPETITAFEHAFFDSKFTHPNMPRIAKFHSPTQFWTALLDGKCKTFPEQLLLPTKNSLATWIKHLENHK